MPTYFLLSGKCCFSFSLCLLLRGKCRFFLFFLPPFRGKCRQAKGVIYIAVRRLICFIDLVSATRCARMHTGSGLKLCGFLSQKHSPDVLLGRVLCKVRDDGLKVYRQTSNPRFDAYKRTLHHSPHPSPLGRGSSS